MSLSSKRFPNITYLIACSIIWASNPSYAESSLDMKKELTFAYKTCLSKLEQGKDDIPELLKYGYKKRRYATRSIRHAVGLQKGENIYIKSPNKIGYISKSPTINFSMYSKDNLIGCKIITSVDSMSSRIDGKQQHLTYYQYLTNTLKKSGYKYKPDRNRKYNKKIRYSSGPERKTTSAFIKGGVIAHVFSGPYHVVYGSPDTNKLFNDYVYIEIETNK